MNKTNFIQTGGFPLKGERLQELQTAYEAFNAFGALAGDMTIISGCETIGTTVKNGFIYVGNEIFEFREATVAIDSTVIIIEEPVNRSFENGNIKTVHVIRYATFGTAEVSWPWSAFKRPMPTKDIPLDLITRLALIEKKLSIFQAGGAVFPWFKPVTEIPLGFQEVVNMRGRMIIGYDPSQAEFDTIGKPGGSKNKTLTIPEMPPHNHSFEKSNSNSAGTGTQYPTTGSGDENGGTIGMQNTGSGTPFSIMNPYRVAQYIEFIG